MRYAQGGGLTAERRRFREGAGGEAGKRCARGAKTSVLRVTERSVERWRRVWRESGVESLVSKGPSRLPKLSDAQFADLVAELAMGRPSPKSR